VNPSRPWPDPSDEIPSLRKPFVTLIGKLGADLVWATGVGQKQDLIRGTRGPLFAAWTGAYESHIFSVPRARAVEELAP
jgi:hypothetical protein